MMPVTEFNRLRIYEAVRVAYEYAATVPDVQSETMDQELEACLGSSRLPDDADIGVLNASEFVPMPNEVVVNTAPELSCAVRALADCAKAKITNRMISKDVGHELQHAGAGVALGFQAVRYGLFIVRPEPKATDYMAYHIPEKQSRPITKLGLAALHAAPRTLSPDDQFKLELMGYDGPEDVAERVVAYNAKAGGPVLPVPMSHVLRQPSLKIC